MIDAGYGVMRVAPNPFPDKAPGVIEICSVSDCISHRPENWIQSWLHNDLGWYNNPADAAHMIPEGAGPSYRLFAYRIHPEFFRKGEPLDVHLPDNLQPEPIPQDFQSRGFDAVSRELRSTQGFDCSPLSCNDMAAEYRANAHCLFATEQEAIAAARRFSIAQPEPGDYYVVEVLEGSLHLPEPDLSEFPADAPGPGEPDLIEEYKEWAAHRYDPGHYLGGTIEPHLRKYALGPRGRKVASLLLAVLALPSLLGSLMPVGPVERVMLLLGALFLGTAAWRMAQPR